MARINRIRHSGRMQTMKQTGEARTPWTDGDSRRWTAVAARDRAADGTFVYAVQSTGIYCRPSCPSRRPRRDRVAFFDAPAGARAAGFRACRRCRPDETDPWLEKIRRACG